MFTQLPMYQRQGGTAFKKTLDNIIALCDYLGNPQDGFKSIHVAGTNGKGSSSHIIAAALQSQGLRVGLYTSPHYKDFRERIKINASFISKEEVIQFIDAIKPVIQKIQPSFFEMTVAMAFQYFHKQEVDVAVIEVGLGGRLDSTNIIQPLLSVITNISFDHMDMLGNTLVKIAGEKAGIIKPGIPVVIGERQKEVEKVFERKAELLNCDISFASDTFEVEETKRGLNLLINGRYWLKGLQFPLDGPFQRKNLKTAMWAIYQLRKQFPIHKTRLKAGIKNLQSLTYFIGRWQILGKKPSIIADSAHNEAGLQIVMQRLSKMPYELLHIVLGFVSDKDVEKALGYFPKNAAYYFAKANIPRGLPAAKLKEIAKIKGLNGTSYESVTNAYKAAQENAKPNDLIFIGGSIFVVAEVL
jgi:dihydrofolate synthase/folylpolyglutamate synthase